MSRTILRAICLLLVVGSLGGCGASVLGDASVREAIQEREAAYARLARAISAYCSARTDAHEAWAQCVTEKQLQTRQLYQAGLEGGLRGTGPGQPILDAKPIVGSVSFFIHGFTAVASCVGG